MSIENCRLHTAFRILVLLAASALAAAQASPAAPPPPEVAAAAVSTGPALAALRPALSLVNTGVTNLRIPHWKAPEDIRSSSLEDVASIQNDLGTTLPPMLDQAEASASPGGPLAPAFAIFRNIDALYDVLLRVTEMANLAGSTSDAARLEDARAALQSARAQLADSLLASVSARDAQIVQLRAQIAVAAKATPPPAPAKIVVNDGPVPTNKHRRKRPATAPAAAPPSQ